MTKMAFCGVLTDFISEKVNGLSLFAVNLPIKSWRKLSLLAFNDLG